LLLYAENKNYFFTDNADWLTNPSDYAINSFTVNNTSSLNLKQAPGGGQAIHF